MWVETWNSSWNQWNTSCSKYQWLIDDIWGKAESIVVQQEAWNEDLVIPPQVIKVDDIESGNFEVPSDDRNKKIVRGSASGDERWLVDMIQTLKNISPWDISAWIHKKKDISSLDLTKW